MILSGLEIKNNLGKGIEIRPFNEKQIGPNSYNLRLSNELLVYKNFPLDMKKNNEVEHIIIPETGYLLEPNKLYLGRTVEYTKTDKFIPMLEGRSSIGRLGVCIHVTAGFGDIGFSGFWTLELFCINPVIIYPNIEICQIYYHTVLGESNKYNSRKYQNNIGIQPSLLYLDFQDNKEK
ncbi:MAG: dCTP deaminase [Clostridia bacterium]|nr:dCTP deaminase [Clostridia bacterium]